nr:hypothetical protein [Tanacetum cinerariifolium]
AFSCRALLDAFGMSLSLNMKKGERSKLENLLGSRLDEFTINDLLIRGKKKGAFDVGLILRLIKSFLLEIRINGLFVYRAKKVGFLMDLFMLEVAPDPLLKHSKFLSLAMALPKLSRESHDRMYHAINLYVQVHQDLCQEQTTKIWSALDLNKLSVATMRLLHLAKSTKLLPFVKQNQFKVFLNDDFGVLQKMLASFSNRVRKLLARLANNAKLIFNDFPGGAESFELITSFCYNNGNIDITPLNVFLLHSASTFMEMTTLTMQTELFLEGTYCWTWSQFAIVHANRHRIALVFAFLRAIQAQKVYGPITIQIIGS